jgi:hypothetical protein
MFTPRSRNGWIMLVIAVLVASTIVTAALAAVLTSLLFPNGFLIDVPEAPSAPIAKPAEPPAETTWFSLGWRASVSCSVSMGDVESLSGRAEPRP